MGRVGVEKKPTAVSLLYWLFNFFSCLSQIFFSLFQHFRNPFANTRLRRRRGGISQEDQHFHMAFPEHLTVDILSRLPAKSLVRFSSVRKAWQALITDPHFISLHLNFNTAKQDQKSGSLLVKNRCSTTRKHVIFLLLHGQMLSKLEIPSVIDSDQLKLVGSCNGLLCVAHYKSANLGSPMILWNPAIRAFRVLPGSVIDDVNDDNVQVRGVAHGFGYHPLIDDYKVVRTVSLSCFGNTWIRAEVYSLKMDSWREADTTSYFDMYGASCTALNGALYWIAYGRGNRELIVSFDICDEVFGELELPDLSFSESPMCTKLAGLKESLYLIVYTFSGRQREIYVWKMIEHDAEVFWNIELTIGPLLGVERPLGCGLSGEIYMESRKGELMLYNPSTQETKNIPTRGLRCSLEVHFYVESLVSPRGTESYRSNH